jgi:hypothetical protein
MQFDNAIGGRSYVGPYRVSGRADLLAFLEQAVTRGGCRVLAKSKSNRAPFLLGVELPAGERLGVAVYAFRSSTGPVPGRDRLEHRFQIRYGAEATWDGAHPVGFDPLGVDATLVLGVDLARDLVIGLDPLAYDPLPMGISFEYTDTEVAAIRETGWHVWERQNRPGRRRSQARVDGLETVVGFAPDRLIDFARFEREASELGLDPPLRFRRAEAAASPSATGLHALEQQFELSAAEILEIISSRNRLSVAVRGGVAERHLELALEADQRVRSVRSIDEDGKPDFEIAVGRRKRMIECKNVSPKPYANGDFKVEVQKTRATQGDPYGRLYRFGQFDIVAACLWSATGAWEFLFRRAADLQPHPKEPTRIGAYQRVDATWSSDITAVL